MKLVGSKNKPCVDVFVVSLSYVHKVSVKKVLFNLTLVCYNEVSFLLSYSKQPTVKSRKRSHEACCCSS